MLVGCATSMKDIINDYRGAYLAGEYGKASKLLKKTKIHESRRDILLWHMEKGTLSLGEGKEDEAITHFQTALDIIDNLYTTKVSNVLTSLILNDRYADFQGANYERSYVHYFLAKSYYSRYLKNGTKLDLQGARATILAWDTYFTNYQRSTSTRSLYSSDLMLKVFGGEVHEASQIRSDRQIALQLYKDALEILNTQGGIFSVFNQKNDEYIKDFEKNKKRPHPDLFVKTEAFEDLQDFLHYKILALTKSVRGGDFNNQVKALKAKKEIVTRASKGPGNVSLVIEEGLIPQKVGRKFNFGLKGAMDAVDDDKAKKFIATVGVEFVTAFAMNKLKLTPSAAGGTGSFIFAHEVTKYSVSEAAIAFELPVIEEVKPVERLHLFILDENGKVIQQGPMPVVTENGNLAKVVLEEDVVSRFVATGTRVAVKHIVAIVGAMQVYQAMKKNSGEGGEFLATTAAVASYTAMATGISSLEEADVRHWTTLPQAFRMGEFKLSPGTYQLGVARYVENKDPGSPSKILGQFQVQDSGKQIFHFKLSL